jgi:hypothetical protein
MDRIFGARPSSYRSTLAGAGLAGLPAPAATVDQRKWSRYIDDQTGEDCVGEMLSGCHDVATGGRSQRSSPKGYWTTARARERIRVTDPLPDVGCDPADAIDGAIAQGCYKLDANDFNGIADSQPTTVEETIQEFQHKFQPEDFVTIADGDIDTAQAYLTLGAQQTDHGIPVGFCMQVDDSYMALNAANPVWNGPQGPSRGGHAQLFLGYVLFKGVLCMLVKGSWGKQFADSGYAYIPVPIARQNSVSMFAMLGGPIIP